MVKSDFSKDEIAEKRKALFELLGREQKREAIFPLFARRVGFCSEMNNLMMFLLYCLHQDIQFRLDSSHMISNLGIKGWEALFHPFCEECKAEPRSKKIHPLFYEFRSSPRIMRCDIPELGIKGDMLHALRIISAILFDLNKETESRIRTMLGTVYNYAYDLAAHIRKGDKNTEDATHYSAQDYVSAPVQRLGKKGLKFLSPRMTTEFLRNINPCILMYA